MERQQGVDQETELLPEDPKDILKLALQKAKEQPVLFWGLRQLVLKAERLAR